MHLCYPENVFSTGETARPGQVIRKETWQWRQDAGQRQGEGEHMPSRCHLAVLPRTSLCLNVKSYRRDYLLAWNWPCYMALLTFYCKRETERSMGKVEKGLLPLFKSSESISWSFIFLKWGTVNYQGIFAAPTNDKCLLSKEGLLMVTQSSIIWKISSCAPSGATTLHSTNRGIWGKQLLLFLRVLF